MIIDVDSNGKISITEMPHNVAFWMYNAIVAFDMLTNQKSRTYGEKQLNIISTEILKLLDYEPTKIPAERLE